MSPDRHKKNAEPPFFDVEPVQPRFRVGKMVDKNGEAYDHVWAYAKRRCPIPSFDIKNSSHHSVKLRDVKWDTSEKIASRVGYLLGSSDVEDAETFLQKMIDEVRYSTTYFLWMQHPDIARLDETALAQEVKVHKLWVPHPIDELPLESPLYSTESGV